MDNIGNPEVLSKLTPEELGEIFKRVDNYIEETLRSSGKLHRMAVEAVRSEAVNEALRAVKAKTGATAEDAMMMALTLYDVAIDAIKQGQRLVIVDQDYRFVREITGLSQSPPESPSHEKVAG